MAVPMPKYLVTLSTPRGECSIEVPSFHGGGVAARRAKWSAISIGWGDVDEVTVVSSVLLVSLVHAGRS